MNSNLGTQPLGVLILGAVPNDGGPSGSDEMLRPIALAVEDRANALAALSNSNELTVN